MLRRREGEGRMWIQISMVLPINNNYIEIGWNLHHLYVGMYIIAEHLSTKQLIQHRISHSVIMYVCMYVSRLGM